MPGKPNLLTRMRNLIAQPAKTAEVRPFFNVVAEPDGSTAEITLYGDVCEHGERDWWTGEPVQAISLDEVKDKLETVRGASAITVHLNSSGGDLFAGITIHNILKSFSGHKTVVVDGLAASAASAIMCAGDTIIVHPSSMVMIHNVSSLLFGYYSTTELRDLLRDHEACELALKRLYVSRTGKTEEELQEMMDATTWMVGSDAVAQGFADEVTEPDPDDEDPDDEDDDTDEPARLTTDGQYLMVAGVRHSVANLGVLPSWLTGAENVSNAAPAARQHSASGGQEPAEIKEDSVTIQNTADLRREYPEFAAAIADEAVQAERERIRAIDDIAASIGDSAMVNRAKFEQPMSAGELALESLKANKAKGAAFVNDLETDAADAKVDDVKGTPTETETDGLDDASELQAAAAEVKACVEMFKSAKKGNQ